MLESRTLTQTIRVHIYESASDMPSDWDNFIAGIFRALPWVLLGIACVAGLVVIAYLYTYLIRKYHKSPSFCRDFALFNVLILLGLAGILYTSFPKQDVFFAQDVIDINIVKDESLTNVADNYMYVKTNWLNGYNVLAAAPSFERVTNPDSVYAAEPVGSNRVMMSLVRPDGSMLDEFPSEMEHVYANASPQTEPDNYRIVIAADIEAEEGEYYVDIAWRDDQRDSLMSVSTAQLLIDTSKDNQVIGNTYNTVGPYLETADTITQDMYETDCGTKPSEDEKDKYTEWQTCVKDKFPKFHHWLNAPHPIYRENIKKITFQNSVPDTTVGKGEQKWYGNTKVCWDIGEHQDGQVIACGEYAGDGTLKVGDIKAGVVGDVLKGLVSGLSGLANKVGCVIGGFLSWFGADTACSGEQWDWNSNDAIIYQYGSNLYNITIGQKDWVNAPVDSSNLFFYTGQNTDYFLLGRGLVPRDNSVEWFEMFDWDNPSLPIPVVGATVDFISDIVKEAANALTSPITNTKVCAYMREYTYGPSPINNKAGSCYEGLAATKLEGLSNLKVTNVANMTSMFEGANFNNIGSALGAIARDTGNVTNMSRMFYYNNDMADFNVSFDTSNVEDFSSIFQGSRFGMCNYSGGKSCAEDIGDSEDAVYAGANCGNDKCRIDISSWDTSKALNMSNMFNETRGARNINVSGINTQNVKDMSYMFMAVRAPKIQGIKDLNTANVVNMAGMFSGGALTEIDLSNFNTAKVMNMQQMFENLYLNVESGGSLDLSSFNTSEVTNMKGMFSGSNITTLNLSSFNTEKVTIMAEMFYALGPATQSINVSSFNTTNVTDMSWMFANFQPEIATNWVMCEGIEDSPEQKVAEIYIPASNSQIEDQEEDLLKKLGKTLVYFFTGNKDEDKCVPPSGDSDVDDIVLLIDSYSRNEELTKFSHAPLDLKGFTTSNVTNMAGMFAGSKSDIVYFTPYTRPTDSEELPINERLGFDTGNVTDMSWMFSGISYSPIAKIPLITDKAEKMIGMFAGLQVYDTEQDFDLSSFSSAAKPDMSWMFGSSCVGKNVVFSDDFVLPTDANKKQFWFSLTKDGCASESNIIRK